MLIDMLKRNQAFQQLPADQQEVYARLATAFVGDASTSNLNLYRDPAELSISTKIGTPAQWDTFLNLVPVQSFISQRMAQITQIAQRKGMFRLQQAVEQGNVTAIKELNELSGVMDAKESQKTVVLHRISRPKANPTPTPQPDAEAEVDAEAIGRGSRV